MYFSEWNWGIWKVEIHVYGFVFRSNTSQSLSLPGAWDGTLVSKGMLKLLLLVEFFDFHPLDARCLHPKQQYRPGFCEGHFPWRCGLRVWLGCKAAQGLDFHDYLIKNKSRTYWALQYYHSHVSQRCRHPVALGIGLENCLTYFQYNSYKNAWGVWQWQPACPAPSAGCQRSKPFFPFCLQTQLWRPASPQRDIQISQVKEHFLVPLNFFY